MRRGIFDNLGLKLFSILFAFVMWFFVSGERQSYTEISYTLPLEFKNIPSDLIITNDFQDKVEIRMNGPAALLNSVRSEKLKYTIDLNDISPGESSFLINTENIDILRGLRITKISPSKINLMLERIVKKTVPVALTLTGELPEGYKIVRHLVTPANVEIRGPQSEVKHIKSVPTGEIELTNVRATIQKNISLVFKDIFHSEIISDKNISATIEIAEEILDKEFKEIPLELRGLEGEEYSFEPKMLDLTLTGTYLNFKHFTKESIVAYINAKDVDDTPQTLKPVIELPLNLTIKSTVPAEFEVVRISKPNESE